MRKLKHVPLASFLLLLPLIASAASPAVLHFKNEPATLFDLGMFRLQLAAARMAGTMGAEYRRNADSDPLGTHINASYEADHDMIYIVTGIMDEAANEEQMTNGCRQVLRMMRINFGKSMWRMFAHYGDEADPAEKPMVDALYDQVELRCWVHGRSTGDARFYGRQPLLGGLGDDDDDMIIGRWRMRNE